MSRRSHSRPSCRQDALVTYYYYHYLTLNRPKHLNAIDPHMPLEISEAVRQANLDPEVHCIVLKGSGLGFCGGYDLNIFAEKAIRGESECRQDVSAGYEPFQDYLFMNECTKCYSELFHSYKPTMISMPLACCWHTRYSRLVILRPSRSLVLAATFPILRIAK